MTTPTAFPGTLRVVTLHDGRQHTTRSETRAQAISRACNALGCEASDVARVMVEERRVVTEMVVEVGP